MMKSKIAVGAFVALGMAFGSAAQAGDLTLARAADSANKNAGETLNFALSDASEYAGIQFDVVFDGSKAPKINTKSCVSGVPSELGALCNQNDDGSLSIIVFSATGESLPSTLSIGSIAVPTQLASSAKIQNVEAVGADAEVRSINVNGQVKSPRGRSATGSSEFEQQN